MALYRLLLPKPGHHHPKAVLPKSTRWCSSSLSGRPEKKSSEAGKEKRDVAEESQNKYMELYSGPTNGQNKVGGSWYSLKGIFANLKEIVLGSPRIQKQNIVETIDSTADRPVPEVLKTKNSPYDTQIDKTSSSIQKENVTRDSHSCKGNISMSLRTDITRENSSPEALYATASNRVDVHKDSHSRERGKRKGKVQSTGGVVCSSENLVGSIVPDARKQHVGPENEENNSLSNLICMVLSKLDEKHVGPENFEHGASGSLVQSSEAFVGSQNNEKCVIATETSSKISKGSSKDMGQSEVKLESHKQHEEVTLDNNGVLESETEYQSCLTHHLPGEESMILQKDVADGFTIVENGNHQLEKRTGICGQTPSAGTDAGKIPASSDGSQEVGLASMFMRTMNGQKGGKMPDKIKSNTLAANGLLDILNEKNATKGEEDIGNGFNINGLIGCIKELPRESLINEPEDCAVPDKTDHVIKTGGSVKRVPSRVDSQKYAKRKESSSRGHAMGTKTNTVSGSEELPCRETPSKTHSAKIEPAENKILVRFLHKSVKNGTVSAGLKDFGDIVKVQLLPLIEGSNFRDAWVHFKTREELKKALSKTELIIGNADVFLEATSLEGVANKVSVPNLIGDPEVPLALVKNPTRTIMIKQLTHDISSHQLKEALAFCGSGISSFFLGSSSSVAYVEFETEDAKERAIAAYSIHVQGKQLLIFRIDVPRTTVVRISNIDESSSLSKLFSMCTRRGKVRLVKARCKGIVDVYFKLAEWPNMLTILNSLNGIQVDGNRLIAQPAPVFLPEVLQVLWSQPDERIHVQSVLRRLLKDSELNVEGTNLAEKYYKDIF